MWLQRQNSGHQVWTAHALPAQPSRKAGNPKLYKVLYLCLCIFSTLSFPSFHNYIANNTILIIYAHIKRIWIHDDEIMNLCIESALWYFFNQVSYYLTIRVVYTQFSITDRFPGVQYRTFSTESLGNVSTETLRLSVLPLLPKRFVVTLKFH